ncbi:MAG: thiol reductant ABC exporter subunit CydC, partial [Betaproteobacteria bacterium]
MSPRRGRGRPVARLLALAWPQRRRVALAVVLQALAVAAGIGLMGSSAWLLSKAALHPALAALQVAIVGVRAFGIGRATLRYLERLVTHDLTLRLLTRLRLSLFAALVPLAPALLQAHRGGDVLGRALEDVATLEGFYVRVLVPGAAALGVAALLAAVLLPQGTPLAAAALCGLVLAGLAVPALASRLAAGPGARLVAQRGALAARVVDGIRGVGELLAFGAEGDHAAHVDRLTRAVLREQARLVRASALGGSLAGLVADLTVATVLVLGVRSLRLGGIEGVSLAGVALVTLASFEAVAALPLAGAALGAQRAAAERLFELADMPAAVPEAPAVPPAAVSRVSPSCEPSAQLLVIRQLRFSYPGEAHAALDGVSLRLDAGRRVALVGPSGSGKSTLAHLLLRFWDVTPGAIALRGRDVRELPADTVREQIAFAAQRAHVFTGTLRENLRVGRPEATTDELLEVLGAVRLDGLLRQLPDGLDAWLGEEGHRLSGGERQRLALARALLRPAPLLLLDEPTAHLDALTERELLAAIVRAGEGRATLLVTHRLVGLEAFDEVIVLARGRV